MYKVNIQENRIVPVTQCTFSKLNLTERYHLQEWLAHEPSALGEDLLVIQKEFDGFDDTKERLDLLAIDKDGHLVIIENKLDDSGRDVVWQALKYASYCSSLSKPQVIKIFQEYLNRYCNGGDANELICEFLEVPDLDEVVINSGNRQRIMFVAAKFRKEVTSTALWLLSNGIQLQCFKVTPFQMGNDLLLNVDQIIPTPESGDLMIALSAKQAEEKTVDKSSRNSHKVRREYWTQLLDRFSQSHLTLYNNISPSKDHWLTAGSGLSSCAFGLIFLQKELRVELSISRSDAEENKWVFAQLFERKEQIENQFGDSLIWLPLEDKKACRIEFITKVDGYDKEQWAQWIEWHLDAMTRFEQALRKPLLDVGKLLKQQKQNQ